MNSEVSDIPRTDEPVVADYTRDLAISREQGMPTTAESVPEYSPAELVLSLRTLKPVAFRYDARLMSRRKAVLAANEGVRPARTDGT